MSTIPGKKDDDHVGALPQDNYELRDLSGEAPSHRPPQNHVEDTSSLSTVTNSSTASILGYCLASISMTVVNKYVVSGDGWNLMFLYLAIQVSFTLKSQ